MKYILITGASSGIGKELAYKFASKNHNLILVARRINILKEIKEDIEKQHKVEVIIKEYDLSNNDNAINLYKDISNYELDTLINNAGMGDDKLFWEGDIDKYKRIIDLNITSLTTLSNLFINDYKDTDAQLINVSSVVGYRLSFSSNIYSATKFYVSALTESIAIALKREGYSMKVKILAPALTTTEFAKSAAEDTKKDATEFYKEKDKYHSAKEMANFGYELYKSDKILGIVNEDTYEFELKDPIIKL